MATKGAPLFIRYVLRPIGFTTIFIASICLIAIAGGSKNPKKKSQSF
jgi:hypothetical protein